MADPATPCVRCGRDFHCGANDPGPCACTTMALDADTLMRLRTTYEGCLCLRCLAAVAAGAPLVMPSDPARAR